MKATAVRSSELAFAAYGVALRITRDEERAVASVESAGPAPGGATAAAFLHRVRRAARLRRVAPPAAATEPRPPALANVSYREWAVLERVALRGMSVTEAAAAIGIDRREALRLLHCGMLAAGDSLSGERQAGHDPQAVGLDVLGADLAAGGLDDPSRDRQAQSATARPAAALER
jgi:hypothetical protein